MDQIGSRPTAKLLVALLFSGILSGVVWAQTPTAATSKPAGIAMGSPDSPNKVVLKVGDQQFTEADIDFLISNLPPAAQRDIATRGKKPLGDQYALIVMLSKQAEVQHLDQNPEFVHRLAIQKQQMEAQEEMNLKSKITPEEEQKYYNDHAADFDQVMLRQIVIREKPAAFTADPAHPAASAGQGLTPEEAKIRAEAIRKELAAGTDIKKVMDDFKAPGDVVIDAEPRKVLRGSMRPEMEKVAFALKDGEVSEPVTVPNALVIFQVNGHSHLALKDVTADIERRMRQEKINATLAEVKKDSTVWMDDQYFAAPLRLQEGPTMGPPPGQTPPKP